MTKNPLSSGRRCPYDFCLSRLHNAHSSTPLAEFTIYTSLCCLPRPAGTFCVTFESGSPAQTDSLSSAVWQLPLRLRQTTMNGLGFIRDLRGANPYQGISRGFSPALSTILILSDTAQKIQQKIYILGWYTWYDTRYVLYIHIYLVES